MEDTEASAAELRSEFTEFFENARATREEYEKQIAHLLQLAVGASLFKAFDVRRKSLFRIANSWAIILGACVVASFGFFVWLVYAAKDAEALNAFFLIRLSAVPILIFAIWFCAKQYANHRRFEEAYAFKSTLSLSLEPYRDLVIAMLSKEEEKQHLEFVVEAIRQIFTAPSGGPHEADSDLPISRSTMRDLIKALGGFAKDVGR